MRNFDQGVWTDEPTSTPLPPAIGTESGSSEDHRRFLARHGGSDILTGAAAAEEGKFGGMIGNDHLRGGSGGSFVVRGTPGAGGGGGGGGGGFHAAPPTPGTPLGSGGGGGGGGGGRESWEREVQAAVAECDDMAAKWLELRRLRKEAADIALHQAHALAVIAKRGHAPPGDSPGAPHNTAEREALYANNATNRARRRARHTAEPSAPSVANARCHIIIRSLGHSILQSLDPRH